LIGDTPTLAADPLHLSVGGAEHHVAASGTLCRSAGAAYELLASFVAAGSLSTSALHLARTRRYAVLFKDDARSSPGAFCWIRLDLRFHVDRAKHLAFPVTFARKCSCTRSPCFRAASTVVTRLERPAWLPRLVLVRLAARLDASRKMPVSNFCNRPDPISSTLRIVRLPTACTFVRRRPRRASPDLRRGCPSRRRTTRFDPRNSTPGGIAFDDAPQLRPIGLALLKSSRSREDGLASEASSPRRCRP